MKKQFKFLTSTRFWAMVLGAIILYLKQKNLLGEAEFVLIETILGGFVAIRTTDRFGEKIGGLQQNETEE